MARRSTALLTDKLGVGRAPCLTVLIGAVTLTTAVIQAIHPGVLESLERTPQGLHGAWWRTVTALFVQDGGIAGAAANLLFLLLVGAIAEQVLSRPRWLLHYFGVGIATELVAYGLQPVGAGNSIAVCGLTGAVALAAWFDDERLPPPTTSVLAIWLGALVATVPALAIPAAVSATVGAGLAIRLRGHRAGARRVVAVATLAAATLLAALGNIHGVALLLALLLAPFTVGLHLRPGRA